MKHSSQPPKIKSDKLINYPITEASLNASNVLVRKARLTGDVDECDRSTGLEENIQI